MRIHRLHRHEVPALNTAALPDLIFTVLFFFMIVTHMRNEVPLVHYQVPSGTELQRLTHKAAVTYIYIGMRDGETRIQLNDRLVSVDQLKDLLIAERRRMLPEDARQMTVSIKADRNTPMGVITDVKQALREAHVFRVSYSATQEKPKL